MSKPREWAVSNEDGVWAGDCFAVVQSHSIPRGTIIVLVEKKDYDALAAELSDAISVNQNAAKKIHALAAELEFSKSETAERESMNRLHLKTMKQLENENEKLKRIIAKELTENDELGCEFVYVNILKRANAELIEALRYYAVVYPEWNADIYCRRAKEALAKHGGKNE